MPGASDVKWLCSAQVNVTQANNTVLGQPTVYLTPQDVSTQYVNSGNLGGQSAVTEPNAPFNDAQYSNYNWCQSTSTNSTTDQGELMHLSC